MDKYYAILGLCHEASEEDIKQAYRDLVKVWHPDRHAHDPKLQIKAQEKLKEINEAFGRLKAAEFKYVKIPDHSRYQRPRGPTQPPPSEKKQEQRESYGASSKSSSQKHAQVHKFAWGKIVGAIFIFVVIGVGGLILSQPSLWKSNFHNIGIKKGPNSESLLRPVMEKGPGIPSSEETLDQADSNLLIKTDLDKSEVYIDEQIRLTYELFTLYDVVAFGGFKNFNAPSFYNYGFWIEDFPIAEQGVVHRRFAKNNYLTFVVKDMALFPMLAGEQELVPGIMKVSFQERDVNGRDISLAAAKFLKPAPLKIKVKDFPKDGKPDFFTGSAGYYSMVGMIGGNQPGASAYFAEKPFDLEVTIKGEGNIRNVKLPTIDFGSNFQMSGLEETMKIPETDGQVSGEKTFNFKLTPKSVGEFLIPKIYFSYFNLREEKYATISCGPFSVYVHSVDAMAKPASPSLEDDRFGDIIVLLDLSGSMLARDVSTGLGRVDVAKNFVAQFIKAFPVSRMGFIAFASEVAFNVPLGSDKYDLLRGVGEALPGKVPDGSAVGDAILEALKEFQKAKTKKGTILLLTDGHQNAGHIGSLSAADLAAKRNVRICIVGLGGGGFVPFPFDDAAGQFKIILTEFDGIDDETWNGVAKITGGEYYKIKNEKEVAPVYGMIENSILKQGSK